MHYKVFSTSGQKQEFFFNSQIAAQEKLVQLLVEGYSAAIVPLGITTISDKRENSEHAENR